jgi:hypothetical protein
MRRRAIQLSPASLQGTCGFLIVKRRPPPANRLRRAEAAPVAPARGRAMSVSIHGIILSIIAAVNFVYTPIRRWALGNTLMTDLETHYVLLVLPLGARAPSVAA